MTKKYLGRHQIWALFAILVLGIALFLMLNSDSWERQHSATQTATIQNGISSVTHPTETRRPTATPTMKPSVTPKKVSTLTDLSVLPAPTIGVTQIPPLLESPTGEDDEFLYKDVIVVLKFDLSAGMGAWAIEYLNLDDLRDNGLKNSDMMVTASEGTGVFYTLGPANNAMNYPAETSMDFATCLDHLREFGGYYWPDHGLPYCFLTDEGRIGVVQYVANSTKYENGYALMSYRITVYRQKVSR